MGSVPPPLPPVPQQPECPHCKKWNTNKARMERKGNELYCKECGTRIFVEEEVIGPGMIMKVRTEAPPNNLIME